jgi:hypothetical protein
VSENWAETHQSCRLAPDWKAYRPPPMGTGAIPATPCHKLGRCRGDRCTLREARKPKWKSRTDSVAFAIIPHVFPFSHASLLLAAVSALLADSRNFEGLPVSTAFTTKHLKVTFANAIILAAGVSLK